jgi:polyhydroxyalkanoate synthesis regulator phasin
MDGEMTMTTHEAKAILDDLETKLADARTRHDETQVEAKEISFAACTGEADARKRLDRLHSDIAKISAEISSLEAAIVRARVLVAEALARETDAAQVAKAQQAMEMVDAFTKRGAELDEALGSFLQKYAALTADFHKLDAIGFAPTTYALVKSNMSAAVTTALQFTEMRQGFLAPHQRRNFVDVIEGWGRNVRMRATARLNSKAAAKAA